MKKHLGKSGGLKNENFWPRSNPFICTFLLQYEVNIGLLTFCQNHMFGKNLFLKCGPKTSRPMWNSSNCNISQTSWGMKLRFCKWLDIHGSSKYESVHVGMVRNAWPSQKWWQIVSQFYRNNELSYAVNFLNLAPTLLANQIPWLLYIKYFQKGLIFWIIFYTAVQNYVWNLRVNFGH